MMAMAFGDFPQSFLWYIGVFSVSGSKGLAIVSSLARWQQFGEIKGW
ncbi:hypothetical protein [Desulfosarcina variabilis]